MRKKEFRNGGGNQLCQLLLSGPGEVWELHAGIGIVKAIVDCGRVGRTEAGLK